MMRETPFLKSERLSLHHLTMDDAHDLYTLDSDPRVMKYINGGRPVLWEGYPHVIAGWLRNLDTRDGTIGFFRATQNSDDAFVGWFHLKMGTFYKEDLELGFRLKSEYWGKGYATEMSKALLDYAFNVLGEERVIATTLARNDPSRRVMEKLGMAIEGYFTYPEKLLPFWDDKERAAVKYVI